MSETFGKATGNLFRGGPANVSWERALEGLSELDARRVPDTLPHSAAQIVAHVAFWQTHLLEAARGGQPAWPEHAAGGWPPPGEWAQLVSQLLADQDALSALGRDPDFLAGATPQGHPWAATLTNFAGHGVYHLGQLVLVRQALGLWPPPGGGDTW